VASALQPPVTAVFHRDVPHDPALALARARELYAQRGLTVGAPLGFNNTFAILVRSTDAAALGLRTVDDLHSVAARWTPGFGYEFLQREDGYAGLVRTYALQFGTQPRAMDLSLIDAFHLTALEDNRHYFPPYDAVPIVRTSSLLRHPQLGRALARLAGHVTEADMRAMNAAVDIRREGVGGVVRRFLTQVPVR